MHARCPFSTYTIPCAGRAWTESQIGPLVLRSLRLQFAFLDIQTSRPIWGNNCLFEQHEYPAALWWQQQPVRSKASKLTGSAVQQAVLALCCCSYLGLLSAVRFHGSAAVELTPVTRPKLGSGSSDVEFSPRKTRAVSEASSFFQPVQQLLLICLGTDSSHNSSSSFSSRDRTRRCLCSRCKCSCCCEPLSHVAESMDSLQRPTGLLSPSENISIKYSQHQQQQQQQQQPLRQCPVHASDGPTTATANRAVAAAAARKRRRRVIQSHQQPRACCYNDTAAASTVPPVAAAAAAAPASAAAIETLEAQGFDSLAANLRTKESPCFLQNSATAASASEKAPFPASFKTAAAAAHTPCSCSAVLLPQLRLRKELPALFLVLNMFLEESLLRQVYVQLEKVPSILTLVEQLAATGPQQKQQQAQCFVAGRALRRFERRQHIENLGLQQQHTLHPSNGSSCDTSNISEAQSAARIVKGRVSRDSQQQLQQQGVVVFSFLLMPLTRFAALAVAAAHGSEEGEKRGQKQQRQQQQAESPLWQVLRISTQVGLDAYLLERLFLPLRLWLLQVYKQLGAEDDLPRRGLTQQQLLLLRSNSNGSMLNLADQLLCCTTPCETTALLESAAAADAAVPEDLLRLRQQQTLQRRLSLPLGRGVFSLGCVDPELYVHCRSAILPLELRCHIVTVAPLQGQQLQQHQKRQQDQQQAAEFTWIPLDEETKDLHFEPQAFCAVGGAAVSAAVAQETAQEQPGHHQRELKSSAFLLWLTRQRQSVTPTEFGGFCLGLSLQGRLHQLDERDWVLLLQGGHGDTTLAPAVARCGASAWSTYRRLLPSLLCSGRRSQQQEHSRKRSTRRARAAALWHRAQGRDRNDIATLVARAAATAAPAAQQSATTTRKLMTLVSLTLGRTWENRDFSASSEGATKPCPVQRSLLFESAATAAGDACAGRGAHPLVLHEEHARLLLAPWGEGLRRSSRCPCSSSNTVLSSSGCRGNALAGVSDAALLAGPAAVALGLAYFSSNDEKTARELLLPASKQKVEDCLCETLAHKVLARSLIRFTSIKASHKWIASVLPPILRILPSDACSTPATFAEGRQQTPSATPCIPYGHLVDRNTGMLIPSRSMDFHGIGTSRGSNSRSINSSGSCDSSNLKLYKASALRAHCLAALLLVLGLRYAGSNDSAAVLLLLQYYSVHASSRVACTKPRPPQNEHQQQVQEQHQMSWVPSVPIRFPQLQQAVGLDPSAANVVLGCCCCGLACVAAGSGRQDVLSVLLRGRRRLSTGSSSSEKTYGDQLLLHHFIGLLFLRGCRWSLQRSNSLAVAALLLCLQPSSTAASTAACGSKMPGQPEKQLYVLAAVPRHLRAVEASTGKLVQVLVEPLLRGRCSSVPSSDEKAAAGCEVYVHRTWSPVVLPTASSIVKLRVASRQVLVLHIKQVYQVQQQQQLPVAAAVAAARCRGCLLEACWWCRGGRPACRGVSCSTSSLKRHQYF
ncbi:hypothetical protein Emed_007032 [Eimeria media]